MCNLKYSIIFICNCYIASTLAMKGCVFNFKIDKFNETSADPPPGDLIVNGIVTSYINDAPVPTIRLEVKQKRDDFNLTLFAIPGLRSLSKCPDLLKENEAVQQLQQYTETCVVSKENVTIDFTNIFTGCYYFMMTNSEGIWQRKPEFFNTTYHFLNKKLEQQGDVTIRAESSVSSKEITSVIKISFECIQVRAQLFELDKDINETNIEDHIRGGSIQASQVCWFSPHNKHRKKTESKCTMSYVTKLGLRTRDGEYDDDNDKWMITSTWANLKHGENAYYLWFQSYTNHCPKENYTDIARWRPVIADLFIKIGRNNLENPIPTEIPGLLDDPKLMTGLCILLGLSVAATLGYWVRKCCQKRRKSIDKTYPDWPEITLQQSKKIMLIYATDSAPFMSEMSKLREDLAEKCGCKVRDVYAPKEYSIVSALGAARWVEKLFKDERKVVWIDTPQFRSLVNHNEMEQYNDFRDAVIPCAVALAKESFHDAATQYYRHFVVRLNEFEIEVGQEDPLLVISPQARYHLPEQLPLLCEHLKDPIKRFKRTLSEEQILIMQDVQTIP